MAYIGNHTGMKYRLAYLFLFFWALYPGCRETDQVDVYVDPEAQPYLDRFIAEAALRDVVIRPEEYALSITIEQIERANVAGQCTQATGSYNHIVIDPVYWRGYTELNREALVFHELGHCILNRGHLDEQEENG